MTEVVGNEVLAHCIGCFSGNDESKGVLRYGETIFAIVSEDEVVGVLCSHCLGKMPRRTSSWTPEKQFRVFKAIAAPTESREHYDAGTVQTQGLPIVEVTENVLMKTFRQLM